MNPLVTVLLAILTPLLMAVTLLVPPYVGVTAASYVIYMKSGVANPLNDQLLNVFYMIDVYTRLFSQWAHHIADTPILTYALPLLLLPILGVTLALWLTMRLSRTLKNMAHSGL